jgi:steroid delta-isomerase
MTQLPEPDYVRAEAGMSYEANVRKYYEFVDADDIPGLIGLFATDATYLRPGYPPLVGRAELERFYRDERVIARGSHELTKVIAAGADVAVHGQFTGVLRDGTQVEVRFADFFALGPDGHFVHRDTFFFSPAV